MFVFSFSRESVLNMASSDSQRRSKRAELPDVNINTGAQSINTERASLIIIIIIIIKIIIKIIKDRLTNNNRE